MPRQKRPSSPFELLDDDFDEDASSQSSRNGNPPMRNAANARERARMRVLSSAFGRLKTKLPNIPADTKLSKLDTLRLATMYIKQLKTVVEGGTPSNAASLDDRLDGSSILNDNCFLNLNSAAQNMTWPFGFHHQLHNSSNRSVATSSAHNLSHATINWCHNEGSNMKHQQQRYTTENYDQQQQQLNGYSNNHPTPPSSYETTSLLQTPILVNGQNHEPTWYSETPSPDLCHSPPLEISYDNINHHHQQQQQEQRNNIMSLIQLSTPPPSSSSSVTVTTHSSAKQSFQQPHHHQHNHSHHAHQPHISLSQHHHHPHHLQQHLQHHHHHHQGSQHLHQATFGNATSFAAASIR